MNVLCIYFPDTLFAIPKIEVRLQAFVQPLLSNFRPVSRKKLVAAAPLYPCGPAIVVDVNISESIMLNIAAQQVLFQFKLACNLCDTQLSHLLVSRFSSIRYC
jgi:hypothetical protein